MKNVLFLFLFTLLVTLTSKSQEIKPKEINVEFYGFVRFESFVDSYKGLNAATDQFYIVPLYTGVDANGEHLNEYPNYNFASMASRVGIKISGPTILNAKTTATIETDFSGDLGANTAFLRLMQANTVFTWQKSALLLGQTLHPFWTGKVFPAVGNINTGSPFHPFNRSPQIRFDYKPNAKMILTAAAVSEFQYKSYGFSKIDSMYPKAMSYADKSDLFARNSAIPELIANVEFNNNGYTLGAGSSIKYLKPTTFTVGISPKKDDKKYVSDELLKSLSFVLYGQYVKNMLAVRAKTVLGQNLTHLTMPGGYGVKSVDQTTGEMTYTPYNNIYSYINAVYGKKYQVGIFAGVMNNLGTKDQLYNFGTETSPSVVTPGMLTQVSAIKRVSSSLALNISKMKFAVEYELTQAEYGKGNINIKDGLYNDWVDATNHRFLVMMMYSF